MKHIIPVLQAEILAPQSLDLVQQLLGRRRVHRRRRGLLHGRRRGRHARRGRLRMRAARLQEVVVLLPCEGALVAGAEQGLLELPEPRLEGTLVGQLEDQSHMTSENNLPCLISLLFMQPPSVFITSYF